MTKTKIDWCDEVWNPTTGCTKVSAGCKNCYAERMAVRFWGERKFTDVCEHMDRLDKPMHWRKPARVFVDSMSDLFHKEISDEFIDYVFAIMATARQHKFMILTKRPGRMHKYLMDKDRLDLIYDHWYGALGSSAEVESWPLPNIHLGVSVEDQKTADERIPLLLQTPAAVHFVSYEPALGPVDLKPADLHQWPNMTAWLPNKDEPDDWKYFMHKWNGIQWVICGCESGPCARPMEIDWARSMRDQCQAGGVPFFLKQMMVGGKLVHMPELDGKVWDEYPEVKD